MDREARKMLADINCAVIQFRGLYAAPLLEFLNRIEMQAIGEFGRESIRAMVEMVLSYDDALQNAMDENS